MEQDQQKSSTLIGSERPSVQHVRPLARPPIDTRILAVWIGGFASSLRKPLEYVALAVLYGARLVDDRTLSDELLLQRIVARHEASLSLLYDRYARLLFSIAFGVVGDRSIAEEVTLDVFTRVWEKGHTYEREKAQVRTWLTRLARNRAIDRLRREQVRPMHSSLSWAEVGVEPEAEGNPETSAHLALQRQQIREALATLPVEQRDALALAYFGGLSHSEIANELDLPLGTVKSRIRAGMEKLRDILSP